MLVETKLVKTYSGETEEVNKKLWREGKNHWDEVDETVEG